MGLVQAVFLNIFFYHMTSRVHLWFYCDPLYWPIANFYIIFYHQSINLKIDLGKIHENCIYEE